SGDANVKLFMRLLNEESMEKQRATLKSKRAEIGDRIDEMWDKIWNTIENYLNVKSDPKISIVCPLYNKIGYIAKTIESVLCQVDNNWELIIVDDGSSDGSYEAALDHSQRDPRIKLIKRSELRSDVRDRKSVV